MSTMSLPKSRFVEASVKAGSFSSKEKIRKRIILAARFAFIIPYILNTLLFMLLNMYFFRYDIKYWWSLSGRTRSGVARVFCLRANFQQKPLLCGPQQKFFWYVFLMLNKNTSIDRDFIQNYVHWPFKFCYKPTVSPITWPCVVASPWSTVKQCFSTTNFNITNLSIYWIFTGKNTFELE